MSPKRLFFALLTTAVLLAADADDKPRRRVRLGGIAVGAGYAYGPSWGGGWGPGWGSGLDGYGPAYASLYSPFWYSPWIHPGLWNGFSQGGANMGQIKLSAEKSAAVYLDGAYAGSTDKLRSMWLEPGAYNLEVKNFSGGSYQRRVYVLSGKTLDIRAQLKASEEPRP